jgi:hypothetical protein
MARNDYRKGALPFTFVPIPKLILDSLEWHNLPPNAIKLALDLAAQYTGKNNGRLTPVLSVALNRTSPPWSCRIEQPAGMFMR